MVPPQRKLQISGQDASARTGFHERSVTGCLSQELGSVIDLRERDTGESAGALGDIQGYTRNLIFTGWSGPGAVRHH